MKNRKFYENYFASYPDLVSLDQFRKMLGGLGEVQARKLMQQNHVKHFVIRGTYVKLDDRVLLKALISRTPVPIQTVESLPNNMGALYDHDQQVIFVCTGMGAEDIFRSVSKELAHAEIAGMSDNYNRNDAAFKAYSASYLLCKKYQISTADYQCLERNAQRSYRGEPAHRCRGRCAFESH